MVKRVSIHKSQSIIEYVAVILVVVAALMTVGIYYKRSIQARYRQTGDVLGQGSQFTPP